MGYSPEAVGPTKSCLVAKSTQHTQRCNLGAQGHSSDTVGVPARQALDHHRMSTTTQHHLRGQARPALNNAATCLLQLHCKPPFHGAKPSACLLQLHSKPTAPSLPSTAFD